MGNNCCYKICCNKISSADVNSLSILCLGLDGAGKTEIGHFLSGVERKDFSSTNGSHVYSFTLNKVLIKLNEIGGSADIRSLWPHYYKEALGLIFVIDCTDYDTISTARQLLTNIYTNKFMSSKPILVVANKQDSEIALDEIDIATFFEIEHLANQTKTLTKICASGLNQRYNLNVAIQWLIQTILDNFTIIRNRIKFNQLANNEDEIDVLKAGRFSFRRPLSGGRRKKHKIQNMDDEQRPKTAPSNFVVDSTSYLVDKTEILQE